MSYPMASLVPASDDVTASLSKTPFGPILDEEDRRREKAALATALDPQGDGSAVHWENPKSGNRGSVVQESHAFPQDGKICRAFNATLTMNGTTKTVGGAACAIAAGDWIVKDMKPIL